MIGIIPAAGKGTRIGDFCEKYPKAILPYKGKPILIHNILRLFELGCDYVYVVVNYKESRIYAALDRFLYEDDRHRVIIVRQENLNGTANAIKAALMQAVVNPDIKMTEDRDEELIMIFGDLIIEDQAFVRLFKRKPVAERIDFVSGQKVPDYKRWVMLEIDKDGWVEKFINKPNERPATAIAWSGIIYLKSAMNLLFNIVNNIPNEHAIKNEFCISNILACYAKLMTLDIDIIDFGTLEDCVKVMDIGEAMAFTNNWSSKYM